jgi:acyl-coenzyme A thioesterase PaaI-like protein
VKRLSHYPGCFGCGSANESGLRLDVSWDGSAAHAELEPAAHYEGGPGVVHGGFAGMLVDEVMALAAFEVAGRPAMTRHVEIDYRAPVLTEQLLRLIARPVEETERKVVVELVATAAQDDRVCFEARGVYVKVPIDAWAEQMAAQGRSVRDVNFDGDPTNFFGWQMQGLREAFVPARLRRPLKVVLEISNVEPPEWTIAAGDSLSVEQGDSPDADARWISDFAGMHNFWDRSMSVDEIVAEGSVRIEGDRSAFTELRAALEYVEAAMRD